MAVFGDDGHVRKLAEIEADVILIGIAAYSGQMTRVAQQLGISRSKLYRMMPKLGINEGKGRRR